MRKIIGNIDDTKPKGNLGGNFLRLFKYALPYKNLLFVAFISMIIYSSSILVSPYIIENMINTIVSRKPDELLMPAMILIIILGIGWSFNFIYISTIAKVGQRMISDLRIELFTHIENLSLDFHTKSESGRIMSRIQNDVNRLEETLQVFFTILSDTLVLIGIVAVMLNMNWKLALFCFSVVPILILIVTIWKNVALPVFLVARRTIANVNVGLSENITGIKVIQSLNREDINIGEFEDLNQDNLQAGINVSRLSAALSPTIEIFSTISLATIVIIGGYAITNDTITVGIFVAFILFTQRFYDPLNQLSLQFAGLQNANAAATHIFELLDEKITIKDNKDAKKISQINGIIEFKNLSFHYDPEEPVLKNLSFKIKKGQKVALIGPTGAGKTTIISLLTKLYAPIMGSIQIDGIDIQKMTKNSLLSHIGTVLQEPFLFSGTILENLKFSHGNLSDEDVKNAAHKTGADRFIRKLEKNYDTIIHENGSNLSPGERQLISITRALAINPRIVILDEATSNIDSLTEDMIQTSLKTLLKGRTSLIIAHRLSTIRECDVIIVLKEGSIIEQGNHEELLANKGHYSILHEIYTRE
tara:strand:- start:422 stop:2188 length:1767 start_codon:yes stop_codon:yes gene_type:complete